MNWSIVRRQTVVEMLKFALKYILCNLDCEELQTPQW